MVTAAAISEAHSDILTKFDRFVLYSTGIVWQMLSQMLTVLLLLRWIRRVVIKSFYAGCVDEKLNVLTPHQEIPSVSHVTPQDGQQIPYGLHILLESMKKQYIKMLQQMLRWEYIETQIPRECERKDPLTKRVKQLENQIDNLIQDSLGLLKARLWELGISADRL